jgi:DNA mismatch endonuclease (patch repair protein)
MSTKRHDFKKRAKFWITKIKHNIVRDREVNEGLRKDGWKVIRFWDFQIKKDPDRCIQKIHDAAKRRKTR